MDFDTLNDLGDFFDEDLSGSLDYIFAEDSYSEPEYTYPEAAEPSPPIASSAENQPLPEFKQEDYESPTYEAAQEISEPARVEELRSEIRQITENGSKKDFMEYWSQLPKKDKDLLFQITIGAIGGGARELLRSSQQSRAQEFQREQSQRSFEERAAEAERNRQFQREMTNRMYEERRAEEERNREARRIAGTPSAMSFNVQPRGIIGQGMGS